MSGETESNISGWTVDTLHGHMVNQLTDMRELFATQLADLRLMMQERYETQTKAVDAAFLAQRTAMETALIAADKAVQTALSSAEKAVAKAELAADKRFESVNEFRAQLGDQANTFIPRSEAEARITALADKLNTETTRNATSISDLDRRVSSRLDLTQGNAQGVSANRADHALNTGQAAAIVTAVLAALAIVVTVVLFVALHK